MRIYKTFVYPDKVIVQIEHLPSATDDTEEIKARARHSLTVEEYNAKEAREFAGAVLAAALGAERTS